jgi:hypothetical protein
VVALVNRPEDLEVMGKEKEEVGAAAVEEEEVEVAVAEIAEVEVMVVAEEMEAANYLPSMLIKCIHFIEI